ncbi:DUF5060 domain-containing protein [Candidatus Roseilinea sp. NK_OTU-006]|jgi:hypothetical protein|uniref:DUF5060 domain-containing protein n=1 Tax=Candidatus Roseilinea sp. NK_OTU-006 TaxID=2704250 RepID=UPI00145EB918|nr:DUF5060 domain-containing protein [Candidatus Roseilinea sp. NK_OTU-006]
MNYRAAALACAVWLAGCATALPPVPPTPAPAFTLEPFETDADCATLCIRRVSSRRIPKWRKLEFDLVTPIRADNPFDPNQIEIDVRFTSPQGDVVEVPAYFYSHERQQGWRARFSPTAEGEWRAQPLLRKPFAFAGEPVAFQVSPPLPGSHGFLRVDRRNPRYLAFDDGTPFFAIGLNLAWWKDDPIADYRRWFDALRANGANTARIWMAPQSFSLEWRDTPLGDYTARMDRAHSLDQVFEMAEARGIYIQLTLLDYSQFSLNVYPLWRENPYNAANGGPCARPRDFATDPAARALFKRRLRYIAARWAYSTHLLAWEWWNEVDFTEMVETELLRRWIEEMTAELRAHDPYRHLVTTSYSVPGDPHIWNMPEIDVVQRHEYIGEDARWFSPVGGGRAFFQHMKEVAHKPVVIGEFAATFTLEQPNALTREGVQFHNGLWAAPFNGFASTAMYWWWDTLVEPAGLWSHYRGLSAFLRGEDLARYAPTAIVVTPEQDAIALGLRAPDRVLVWLRNRAYNMDEGAYQYGVQIATGQAKEHTFRFVPRRLDAVTLELEALGAGRHRVQWFDTVSGALLSASDVAVSDGKLIVRAPPFNRDLAAKVTPAGGAPGPH